MPSDRLLRTLVYNWGNVGFSADIRYLKFWLRETLTTTDRTVLECGSGLTTLLLGVVADRQSHTHLSLEHDSGWYERMHGTLNAEGVKNTTVHYCPLKDYGEFEWYGISDVGIPDEPVIDFVICDGPPAQTRGGRVGLPYVLGSRFADGCIIAADDAHRTGEREIMSRWMSDFGLREDAARSDAHFKILLVNRPIFDTDPIHV